MDQSKSRREFLKVVTALGAAGLPGAAATAASPPAAVPALAPSAARPAHHGLHGAARSDAGDAFLFFTAPEAAFVEAALASLIPADELGPGAREAGVAYFIDRELAGAFGAAARSYRQGPWPEGTPEQGFQSRLTPKEIYRVAIAETDAYCRAQYGKPFDALGAPQREEVLTGLESGAIALASVSARMFFGLLWSNAQEGFFADPMYGGNRDKAGWALVGFPGVAASYIDEITRHNVPYRVVPVSIADVRQGHTAVDGHGHAIHTPLDKPG
jgi:gluconate 2-dehydrogenase gamma chain